VLFNEPKLLKFPVPFADRITTMFVSVLFNEPKLLKYNTILVHQHEWTVSVLFNEPKLLKSCSRRCAVAQRLRFSALQRAEIAEMLAGGCALETRARVSVLFNEPKLLKSGCPTNVLSRRRVSVLFNEPKLLK